jgi:integrase
MFNFAVKYYKLQNNPARICGSMGKKDADSMQFWTVEEFNRFIPHIIKPIPRIAFILLFWTGIRSGECLAITLDDFIDTSDGKAISVNKNYARLNSEDLLLDPKTPKSNRLITIPDFVYQEVLNYVNQLYDYQNDERLIPITKTLLNKEIIKGAAVADLKRIRVHDLRHSHASLLIELGYSPLLIS